MNIREATIHDIEFIGKIYTDSRKVTYSGMIAQEYLDSLSYQVAESDSKIIGFVAGYITEIVAQSELYALYVDTNLKNKGIGSKLLASLI